MGNHYHLQLETPQANLSRAMQWLNLSYGAWFNRTAETLWPLIPGAIQSDPARGRKRGFGNQSVHPSQSSEY
jgi:hypothetical protein